MVASPGFFSVQNNPGYALINESPYITNKLHDSAYQVTEKSNSNVHLLCCKTKINISQFSPRHKFLWYQKCSIEKQGKHLDTPISLEMK